MNVSTKPSIHDLGRDLLHVSPLQRTWSLAAPLLAIALYFFFAFHGWWPAAVLAVVYLSFVSYGSTSHDLVHDNLGLPAWLNTAALMLIEMLCLRSGRAYRLSHLHHHRRFPHDDDIEGSTAHAGLFAAILHGPVLQYRLWWWAWRNSPRERAWLGIEAIWFVGFLAAACAFARLTPVLWVYAALVIGGSWIFPLVTVYVPHDPAGVDALTQTRLFRGLGCRIVAMDHLYHLEHHLYPAVPHHHWKTLASRLDPYFAAHGVRARRLGW